MWFERAVSGPSIYTRSAGGNIRTARPMSCESQVTQHTPYVFSKVAHTLWYFRICDRTLRPDPAGLLWPPPTTIRPGAHRSRGWEFLQPAVRRREGVRSLADCPTPVRPASLFRSDPSLVGASTNTPYGRMPLSGLIQVGWELTHTPPYGRLIFFGSEVGLQIWRLAVRGGCARSGERLRSLADQSDPRTAG